MIEFFKALFESLYWSMVDIWITLTFKHPCEKCIVRACCSEKCEEVVLMENFFFPHTSMKEKKRWAILYLLCITSSVGSLVILVVKELI